MNIDLYFFHLINGFAFKWTWLDFVGFFCARYLEYFLIIILLLFLLVNFKKYWQMVVKALVSAILANFVIVEFIRFLWQRQRPFLTEPSVNVLFTNTAPSFPSGHAAFYFVLSTVVFLYFKKIYPRPKFWWGVGVLFFVISFLICSARIFCGIHWPSDILAGAIVGIFSGWLINKIFKKYF